jgi:MOSC domain-containing protein YiiM
MKIVTISTGEPRKVVFEGKTTVTGIFKTPVDAAVFAGEQNLQGDGQADLSVHGGRDKALYFYSQDYYALWTEDLGRATLEAAQFGENLTVSGCRDEDIVLGSRMKVGGAVVTVMQPRIPCFKLGIRIGDASFPNRFWTTGRLGFYARVDQPGLLQRGDPIEVIESPTHGITVRKLWLAVIETRREAAIRAMQHLPELDAGWLKRLRLVAQR